MKNYEFIKMWVLFHLGYTKSSEKASQSNEIAPFTLVDIWRFLKLSLVSEYPTILELWELVENLQHDGLINIDEDQTLSKSHLSITSNGLSFLINLLKESSTNSEVDKIKDRLYDLWARDARRKDPFAPFYLVSTQAIKERLSKYLEIKEKKMK